MFTKKTMIVAAMVAALGAGAVGVGVTHAAPNPSEKRAAFVSEIVSAIAEKFGLSEADVQAVFDEQAAARKEAQKANHEEMIANHNEKFDEMLAQAVTDGELTQSQADSIADQRDELQTYAKSLKDETPEARRDAMKEKLEELKAWAEENGIPMKYVRFLPPPAKGHMGGRQNGGQMNGRMMESQGQGFQSNEAV